MLHTALTYTVALQKIGSFLIGRFKKELEMRGKA